MRRVRQDVIEEKSDRCSSKARWEARSWGRRYPRIVGLVAIARGWFTVITAWSGQHDTGGTKEAAVSSLSRLLGQGGQRGAPSHHVDGLAVLSDVMDVLVNDWGAT